MAKEIDLKLGDIKESSPPFIQERIALAAKESNFYPKNYDGLANKIADINNLNPENILLVNGTDGSIDLIAKTFAKKIVYFEPTYYEFMATAKRNKIPAKAVKTWEIDPWPARVLVDLSKGSTLVYNMPKGKFYAAGIPAEAFEEGTVLFLCSPNNPFGKIYAPTLWPIVNNSKGIVAVDEAYHKIGGDTFMHYVKDFPNLLIMRSFSKDFGMAGLRIGYIAGDAELIKKLEEGKVFFDISNVSVEGAKAALDNKDFFKERTKELVQRKKSIEELLANKGLPVVYTSNNNLLLNFSSEPEANAFVKYLNDNKVIVNQGNGISTVGLDNSWVRFACGTEEQMQEVEKIIKGYETIAS